MKKKLFIGAVLAAFGVTFLWLLQVLLMPKYMSDIKEGALISEYYKDVGDHDVVFIGDCEVYENFSPVELWEKYGITSYIRGSAQQLIWQSYYLMEETLHYETPKVMVFNVLSMKYDEPQDEAYNRMTLDGMRWGPSKAASIQASMTKGEDFFSYVFPILRYHSRWDQLNSDDFRYLFSRKAVSSNGYLMQVGVKPAGEIPAAKKLADYQFSENCYRYLDKMVKLCAEHQVRLVLIKAPSLYPYWYDEWDAQIESYAKEHGLSYYNFLEDIGDIGLDFNQDTYDGGLHLNVGGAEKLSDYFGNILRQEFGLDDHRSDTKLQAAWNNKTAFYNRTKEELYSGL